MCLPAILLTMGPGFMGVGILGSRPAALASRDTNLVAAALHSTLRDLLMRKVQAMSDTDHGVFHDDVAPIVASYFPAGQPFAETERVLAEQRLGPLRRFHGKADDGSATMYVSHTELMSAISADVSVVIDFDFAGQTERDMTVKKVRAFLQAPSM